MRNKNQSMLKKAPFTIQQSNRTADALPTARFNTVIGTDRLLHQLLTCRALLAVDFALHVRTDS